MNNVMFRKKSYNVILLSVILLLLLVSVQLSIPVAAETNHQSTTLTLKTNSWHSWTRNPDFNSYGLYWKARTWKWHFTSGDNQPGGANDKAYFYIYGFEPGLYDYRLYAKVQDYDDFWYVHCAGATQGWVWSDNPPSGIYQPNPLRITSSIEQLKSKTNFLWYNHAWEGTWGVLSNVWFKVYHVYDGRNGVFFDGILGIDFYYESGNQAIHDGSFRIQGTTMIYTKMPPGGTGTGIIYFDILQALIEAQWRARESYLYFDISNCELYQAEILVESHESYAAAKYSYFNVYYYDSGKSTGLQLSYPTTTSKDYKNDFLDIRKTSNITYSIQKICDDIKMDNNFYKITVRTLVDKGNSVIDLVRLIAVEKESNNATEIPVYLAFSQRAMKYINTMLAEEDGRVFELTKGDIIELWFDSNKIPYDNYELYLLLAVNII
ncbi:MAG: hypothetical protein ACP6IU_05170 [Candidatus Asgardarchaeia archaeon]